MGEIEQPQGLVVEFFTSPSPIRIDVPLPVPALSSNDVRDMQCILGVDLSAQPCEITVSRVDGEQVEVLERTTAVIPLFQDRSLLTKEDIRPLLKSQNDDKLPSNAVEPENPDEAQQQINDQVNRNRVLESVEVLRQAIGSLETEWTASSVIIPPHQHVALNITLPFGDQKSLSAIVDNQIQDVLPFETDEFLIQYCTVGLFEAGTGITSANEEEPEAPPFDIHVAVIPRGFVRNVLALCKASGLEPNILTVPSSAIAAVYHLGKSFFKANSAIVFNRGDEYSMAVLVNGEVRVERALLASNLLPADASERREDSLRHIFTALKLMIASTERRYGTRIENVYLLGRDVKGSNLQQLFGRPLEGLKIEDLVRSGEPQMGIAALSAVFAKDEDAPIPLTNYRSGEFSFTPKFGEFIRALSGAKNYMLTALATLAVGVFGMYAVREFTISQTERALVEQIRAIIPQFENTDGDIGKSLFSAQQKLSNELGVLGSPAKVSVLDALLEILKLIPADSGVTITSIKVTGTKATIQGSAPSISACESVAKALKTGKDVFSEVNPPRTSPSGSKFNFTVEAPLAL
jgi:hypothetical protein